MFTGEGFCKLVSLAFHMSQVPTIRYIRKVSLPLTSLGIQCELIPQCKNYSKEFKNIEESSNHIYEFPSTSHMMKKKKRRKKSCLHSPRARTHPVPEEVGKDWLWSTAQQLLNLDSNFISQFMMWKWYLESKGIDIL